MGTAQRVDGVDISHHQSEVLDFAGAKARGLKWVYHKATEGDSYKDPNYSRRRTEAKAAGLPFGAYHFARPEVGDAVAEAKFFLSVAKPLPGDLRPALDLETMEGMSLADIRKWAASFIAEVVRQTGHRPIVYTPFDLGPFDDGCLIWRPRYNDDNRPPALPWDIWQFSNGILGVPDSYPGFGHVDLNTMRDGLLLKEMRLPAASEDVAKTAPVVPKESQIQRVLRIAKNEVGYKEGGTPGHHNNDQKYSDEVPGLEWSDRQPWCQTWVTWVARAAGVQGLFHDPQRPTASCDVAMSWYKSRGQFSSSPRVGDQVFYGVPGDSNHTGIVYKIDATYIYTYEGNTNDEGSREGYEVAARKRRRDDAYILGYGHPKYVTTDVTPDKDASPEPMPLRPVLRVGSKGSQVKVVQKAVGVTQDGVFGPKTKAAVMAFQSKHGLTPDGIVGPKTWAAILAPKPKPKKTAKFKVAHASLEYTDTPAQQTADLEVLFARGYDWLTGTESGHKKDTHIKKEIARLARKYGYLVSLPDAHDTWIAVKKTLVASGWMTGSIPALPSSKDTKPTPPGNWGPKGVTWAAWSMGDTFGEFGVAAVHPLTWRGTGTPALKQEADEVYMSKVNEWYTAQPKAMECFVNGDFNRDDRKFDVFMGKAPFITAADELQKWENTGHGPIDATAREKTSTRVKCISTQVLDDTELPLNGDHFVVESVYQVAAR